MRNNTRSSFKTDICLQVLISFIWEVWNCPHGDIPSPNAVKISPEWSYSTTQTENLVFKYAALDAVLVCERFCRSSKGQGLNVWIWWVEELTRLCQRRSNLPTLCRLQFVRHSKDFHSFKICRNEFRLSLMQFAFKFDSYLGRWISWGFNWVSEFP